MSLQNAKATVIEHSRKRTANFDLAVDFENKKLEDGAVGLQSGSTDGGDSVPGARAVLQTNHLVELGLSDLLLSRAAVCPRFQNKQRSRFSFFLESRRRSPDASPADLSIAQTSV